MFIATTTSDTRTSSAGAALLGILAPTGHRQWPSECEDMPLLRSLADRAARVAINMPLLTELFASLMPPLQRAKDARKERGHSCPPVCRAVGNVRSRSAGAGSNSVRSAMFIATTTSDTRTSSVGAALLGILAPTGHRQSPSECEDMPLLRSLADREVRLAINMPLLTELWISLSNLQSQRDCVVQPRVARSSQPWASGKNPFGILWNFRM